MNDLQLFNYEGRAVRTIAIEGEPWWVAKDVCDVLDIQNPTMSLKNLESDEVTKYNLGGLSGESNIVNESGLYSLILQSRKPEAKKFKKWITSEVLPSIRKTGQYAIPKSDDELILIGYQKLMDRVKSLSCENDGLKSTVKLLVHDYDKCYTTTQLAKELHLKSAQELNNILKKEGIQYKQNDTWVLTSKYSDKNYTEIKQEEKNGMVLYHRLWTGEGRAFLLNRFGITP